MLHQETVASTHSSPTHHLMFRNLGRFRKTFTCKTAKHNYALRSVFTGSRYNPFLRENRLTRDVSVHTGLKLPGAQRPSVNNSSIGALCGTWALVSYLSYIAYLTCGMLSTKCEGYSLE